MWTSRPRVTACAALLGVIAIAGGCGSDSAVDDAGEDAPAIEVIGAWARTSPMLADTGAAYMTITSADDDVLVSVSVDPAVAASVEIHETVAAADESMGDADGTGMDMSESSTTMADMPMDADSDMPADADSDMPADADSEMPMDGAMTMRELENGLELPAGEPVVLEPGGYHLMLRELAEPLVEGQTFDLTLTFANGDDVMVSVEVRTDAP